MYIPQAVSRRNHRQLPVVPVLDPIFIVGMYKCGTSWLLSCLNAHPDLAGVKEIDLIKCLAVIDSGGPVLRPRRDRLARVFGGTAWCKLTAAQLREGDQWSLAGHAKLVEGAGDLYELEPQDALSVIRASQRPDEDDSPPECAPLAGFSSRLFFGRPPPPLIAMASLTEDQQLSLYETIASADSLEGAMTSFLRQLQDSVSDRRRLVLKAADQIHSFQILRAWKPGAPAVAIVRDGRDAAISALHFRELTRRRGYAWVDGTARPDLENLLKGWVNRAARVLEERGKRNLYVLRYEDLTLDFHGTLSGLLAYLGVRNTWYGRARINHFTNFHAVTGRKRGESAASIRRRGSIREWTEVFSKDQAERCWGLAGEMLSAFGYTETGALRPLPS